MGVLVSLVAALAWLGLGWIVGLDHALSDYNPSPTFPTLVVIYLPLAGGSLLVTSARAHARSRVITERRSLLGVAVCVVTWTIC